MTWGVKKTHKEYCDEVRQVHGTNIKVVEHYIDDGTKIKHKCRYLHVYPVRPNHVLRGVGCPECAKRSRGLKHRKTHEEYVDQVNKIHEGNIEVLGDYEGAFVKVKHKCMRCNFQWMVTPDNIVNTSKTGCPKCAASRRHSLKGIRWLKEVAKKLRIRIRHADNWGEYNIPGTNLRVDGFHKPTKTIFEFHGDCFHGNPNVYSPRSKPSPFSNKTASRLYKETCDRIEYFRSLGYNVVEMWENDYDTKIS
jgi:DNA-directed RNA polymerase subunit RPC12/RpoP